MKMTVLSEKLVVTINGEPRSLPASLTIDELLSELGLRRDLVAVELNRDLIRKKAFSEQRVSDGDRLEIVEFVGGG
jgi:thiamine biosynthesis protein ThiS